MSALEQAIPEGYKQTDVGVIPVDWNVYTLGELSELTSSKRIFESDYVNDGVPFYRGQEISSLLENKEIGNVIYISKRKYSELKSRYGAPKPGEILITAVGTLGNALLIKSEEPFYFKDGNLIWARKIKNCSPQYLINQLNYNKKRVLDCAIGSSQKALTMVSLSPLAFAIPESSKEQTAIANALSDVDALLTELEKLIAKKQAIKTATMQQLLTGKTRLPKFATYTKGEKQGQPKGTKPSELGEIPEDWDVIDLGEYCSITKLAGFEYSNYFNSYKDGGEIIVIRGTNITHNVLNLDDIKTIPISTSKKLPRSQLKKGDLVFAYVGTIGPVYLIEENLKYHLGPNTAKITCNSNLDENFLFSYFKSPLIRKEIEERISVGAQPSLSMGKIRSFKIILPSSKSEQAAIAEVLTSFEGEIQTLEQRLAKTRQIKQGMMQELLTGRTRLPFDKAAQQGN